MTDLSTLERAMLALRLMAVPLAMAIILWWGPSLLRVARGRERDGDAARSIWVPVAVAAILFQARWLYPDLADVTRARIWLVALATIVAAMLGAIYYHGSSDDRFRLRRTALAHLAMFATSILFAWSVQ